LRVDLLRASSIVCALRGVALIVGAVVLVHTGIVHS
jgi:hypothetical protein